MIVGGDRALTKALVRRFQYRQFPTHAHLGGVDRLFEAAVAVGSDPNKIRASPTKYDKDGWQSGLMHLFTKQTSQQWLRGFESLTIRHV